MQQWEYAEVDFTERPKTRVYYYDTVGNYIDKPVVFNRLGVTLAKMGLEGWEIISSCCGTIRI